MHARAREKGVREGLQAEALDGGILGLDAGPGAVQIHAYLTLAQLQSARASSAAASGLLRRQAAMRRVATNADVTIRANVMFRTMNLYATLSATDRSRAVGLFADGDAQGVVGQELLNEFGPFDETEMAAVEVLLVAHVIDFGQALDAVEVEVVDWSPL